MMSGDGHTPLQGAFLGLWHCLRIVVLFVLWKLRCKFVFEHEVLSLSAFSLIWKDEVCHQWLAKEALLIKDAQSLDHTKYSTSNSTLVALRKRL
jgi:hypothetical protein